MKLVILAVGKEKDFAGSELVAEYTGRIAHYVPIEWRYVPAGEPKEEEAALLKVLDKEAGSYVVSLDEKGKEYDSRGFTTFIQNRMNHGDKSLIFIIGGSYGLPQTIKERSSAVICLSMLTFPHQLVRLVLSEQIYRACTIMKGEKYHH